MGEKPTDRGADAGGQDEGGQRISGAQADAPADSGPSTTAPNVELGDEGPPGAPVSTSRSNKKM